MGIYICSSLFALLVTISVLTLTEASGAVFIRFLRYENWDGTGDNGHCCDGKWSICQANGCDHYFKICMDKHGQYGCTFGKYQSGSIDNQNVIDFGDNIANLSNPMPFPFKGAAPDKVDLKVAIYDEDNSVTSGHNDFIEFLKGTVPLITRDPVQHSLKGRTKLTFEIWYKCSAGDTDRCTYSKGQKRDFYNGFDGLDELEF